jgi:hypothetical protein
MIKMNVNGYSFKVMNSVINNPQAPKATMEGIKNAAEQEPGSVDNYIQFSEQRKQAAQHRMRTEPPDMESPLTRSGIWENLRARLNEPGSVTKNLDAMEQNQQRIEMSTEPRHKIYETEFLHQDAARKQERREMMSDYARMRTKSGKSQVAQRVRNAYTNLTGANIAAVRKAFDVFAG